MIDQLLSQLSERGYQARIVPIRYLADLWEEIEGRCQQGLVDQELYQTYLARFIQEPPASLPGARSMIIVAVPQPQVRVTFAHDGNDVHCMIPPTYAEDKVDDQVLELLEQVLTPRGHRVVGARVPKKLLAVRSGLAVYGKNNISYVPGMGSFYGLVVLLSDLPAQQDDWREPADDWREPAMMDRCQTCSACLHSCPTGAISPDRFLLHAERCLTYHNEKPGDVPFAAWIDPAWHNCLVGCLDCQKFCPENRECRDWVEDGPKFSRVETGLLLEGLSLEQLPPATVEKLERLGMASYADILPRNLNALFDQQR